MLVTEESHDGVHYVAHNKFYEQVGEGRHEAAVTLKAAISLFKPLSLDKAINLSIISPPPLPPSPHTHSHTHRCWYSVSLV